MGVKSVDRLSMHDVHFWINIRKRHQNDDPLILLVQQSFTHLVSGSVFWRDLALRRCPRSSANEEAEAQQHLVTEWAEVGQSEEAVVNSVTGTPWRLADGQRIVDRPQVRVDAVPPPPMPFEGVRDQRN